MQIQDLFFFLGGVFPKHVTHFGEKFDERDLIHQVQTAEESTAGPRRMDHRRHLFPWPRSFKANFCRPRSRQPC